MRSRADTHHSATPRRALPQRAQVNCQGLPAPGTPAPGTPPSPLELLRLGRAHSIHEILTDNRLLLPHNDRKNPSYRSANVSPAQRTASASARLRCSASNSASSHSRSITATQEATSCAVGTTPLAGVHRSGIVNTNPASPKVSRAAHRGRWPARECRWPSPRSAPGPATRARATASAPPGSPGRNPADRAYWPSGAGSSAPRDPPADPPSRQPSAAFDNKQRNIRPPPAQLERNPGEDGGPFLRLGVDERYVLAARDSRQSTLSSRIGSGMTTPSSPTRRE